MGACCLDVRTFTLCQRIWVFHETTKSQTFSRGAESKREALKLLQGEVEPQVAGGVQDAAAQILGSATGGVSSGRGTLKPVRSGTPFGDFVFFFWGGDVFLIGPVPICVVLNGKYRKDRHIGAPKREDTPISRRRLVNDYSLPQVGLLLTKKGSGSKGTAPLLRTPCAFIGCGSFVWSPFWGQAEKKARLPFFGGPI